uniref:Uncharacterized protein n=1 Tax=Megaselia scalaris TaxID=36166 RepID=T1H2N3_MEGSC
MEPPKWYVQKPGTRYASNILDVRFVRGANIDSDYNLVRAVGYPPQRNQPIHSPENGLKVTKLTINRINM